MSGYSYNVHLVLGSKQALVERRKGWGGVFGQCCAGGTVVEPFVFRSKSHELWDRVG